MLSYLAIGDSYTIGEGVPTEDNFPNQLVQQLTSRQGYSIAPPRVIATTGWTTDELLKGIVLQEPLPQYDFVTLLIGVNNQYRGYATELFRKEFALLLYKAILQCKHGSDQVFVLSIPDWGVTPFANDRNRPQIAQEIAAYNLLKKSITLVNKCKFIDITPSSIKHGNQTDYLVEDLLHYAAKEYSNWVDLMMPVISPSLAKLR